MNSPFGSPLMTPYGFGTQVDIKNCPTSYEYVINVPGIKARDIEVLLEHRNVLLISGQPKGQEVKEGEKYLQKDRKVCKLVQKLELPQDANNDAIKAVYEDGVLTLTVGKLLLKIPRIIEVENMVANV